MKKSLLIFACVTFIHFSSSAQLFTFTFNGTGTCPTQGSSLAVQPANITVGTLQRNGTILCSTTNDAYTTTAWPSATAIDVSQYIELTITPAAGYTITYNSIGFSALRSSTGPLNARIAHDGGTGTFTATSDFTPALTSSYINWPFTSFSSAAIVKFRIYGWNASGSTGSLRLDDLYLNATVSQASPINIDYTNGRVGIGVAPSNDARLNVAGKLFTSDAIAIGTTDLTKIGTKMLAVNGDVIFNKAQVKLYGTWPDYVFDESYGLPDLIELEAFIKKYKHLPGVQPAADAQANGIDLGSTQATLLKKVEELSLYIIEQNKILISQQQQLKELEKQLDHLNQLVHP